MLQVMMLMLETERGASLEFELGFIYITTLLFDFGKL